MFSTATDRFFHGMNKKHTKMIDTTNLKASLQQSRSQRHSNSKSRTTRIFSPAHKSLRSTFNISFQINSHRSNQNEKFAPPKPYNQNQSNIQTYRRKSKFRLNLQANYPDSSELNSLIEKHINKNEKIQNQSGKPQGLYGRGQDRGIFDRTACSLKDQLRKKVEQLAIKKYESASIQESKNNIQRINKEKTKTLQTILNKDKAKSESNETQNAINNQRKQKVKASQYCVPIDEKFKQQQNKQLKRDEIKKGTQKIAIAQNIDTLISNQQLQSEKKSSNKISEKQLTTTKKDINPKQVTGIKHEKQRQQQQNIKEQQKIAINKEKVSEKLTQRQTAPKKSEQNQNKIDSAKQTKISLSQIQNKPVNSQKQKQKQNGFIKKKQSNTFWSQEMQDQASKQIKNKKQQSFPINNLKSTPALPKANINQMYKTRQSQKIQADQLDELQEITFQQLKKPQPDNKNQMMKKPQPEAKRTSINIPQQAKKIKTVVNQQKKQTPNPVETVSLKQNKLSSKQAKQASIPKQSQKKQTKIPKKVYNIEEIQDKIENTIIIIEFIGGYGNDLKPFYSKNNIQPFNTLYKVLAYYLWQQFYYLRQKCLTILTKKNQDFFSVPKDELNLKQIQQFLQQQIETIAQQTNNVTQKIQKLYEIAKQQLPASQSKLQINKETNYHDKCIQLLQKQFIQIQKQYKKAVKNSNPKQTQYLHRLCQIIEIFCQLKFFNGEKTKQFQQVQTIQQPFQHYQSYKHLVLL